MDYSNPFDYIKAEENSFATVRVPLTNSKDWNMKEHIERCLNVANGWFHTGKNDGLRPYDDIVTPIIDVAFRSEGFDVKHIVPYVDDINQAYKSFIIKKFHPDWAKKNQLDTFIDEVVESSIIFDLALIKDVNRVRPEVISLQDIAFCDQTDVLSGPLCFKHNYSIPDLLAFKGKWNDAKIDEVIVMAKASKKVSTANDKEAKTPGKYIECYELHGMFPESWLKDDGDPDKFVDQMHIVNYYTATDGSKNGICLYKGKSKKIKDKFKALKIDTVRSKGRACGRSIVERLFEPQVWHNYSAIKLKKMLDSAVNLLQTDSDEFGNKKVSDLKENTVLKHELGRPITRIDMNLQNVPVVQGMGAQTESRAQKLGNASDASLGIAPVSGTPFALQNLIVEQGEGIHELRKGKISTFFSDVLYPELIMGYLVKDINSGVKFSEELSLDEMQEIAEVISVKQTNDRIKKMVLEGKIVTPEMQAMMTELHKAEFKKGGSRKFFETLADDLSDVPVKVKMNIAGKQKNLAADADKLSKLISQILANPQAFAQVPGLAKTYNQLIEASGLSPIDFSQITAAPQGQGMSVKSPIDPKELEAEKVLN
jgi:hypothetical protein